ncbi:GTP cyclohydrolase I FolE [Niabella aurantiaca]|uniref:GTP cyclohydrolase I FolE n=1 Tax=Niabella aurantiaca TaxID=379900 RepID=UPI000365B716|nr:GTP cyclohydrolase I FolE [Niabella aurantiaca]
MQKDLMQEIIDHEPEETLLNTPLRAGAFELTDQEKISEIEYHFARIMYALGLDLNDDSLSETPKRVAKMFVKEMFSGLNPANQPRISLFENKYRYNRMLVEKDITLYSCCEHHFVPIIGKAHVAYIPGTKVIGLSKINRLVQYYARRPQVQERLTIQIANGLKEVLQHNDVAVMVEADHLCVASRGIKDTHSSTVTVSYSGKFQNEHTRAEFLSFVGGGK